MLRPLALLQTRLPEGVPVPIGWLRRVGLSSAAIYVQVKGGWLQALPGRAYQRPGPPLAWPAVLYGAQQTGSAVHLGHLSALNLHGTAHYLALGQETPAHLYLRTRPPEWLQRFPLPSTWHHETVIREPLPAEHVSNNLREPRLDIPVAQLLGIVPVLQDGWTVFVSSPERAAVELAASLMRGESWDTAYETFTGLTTLRPRLVQQLLAASASKVTRRIFLHLARSSGHAWLAHLDVDALDLGQGKRQVVPGGRLDPEFLITVPRREETYGF
ncbi:type IV toxin-antitoxin system AbiEi family antitoxin domain-containing protein [Deinococcus rubellus]|uniref:type IV toxin-antitoxin system AbiEi family antitoxin domain-containing protein n=1 Tax=Deinococcus rubellus TaxID=1889240 RepID=UPI0031EBF9A5